MGLISWLKGRNKYTGKKLRTTFGNIIVDAESVGLNDLPGGYYWIVVDTNLEPYPLVVYLIDKDHSVLDYDISRRTNRHIKKKSQEIAWRALHKVDQIYGA